MERDLKNDAIVWEIQYLLYVGQMANWNHECSRLLLLHL